MPAIAPAAFVNTVRLIRLSPLMSTTECIMRMSRTPTQCLTCPLAKVLTMSLGMPKGKARIAAVAMVVPAEPPKASTPSTCPLASKSRSSLVVPFAAASMARPRSFAC